MPKKEGLDVDITRNPDIFTEAINTWGFESQIDMALKEMSSLSHTLLKYRQLYNTRTLIPKIQQEIADVYIIICQLERMFFDPQDDIGLRDVVNERIERLKTLIIGETMERKYGQMCSNEDDWEGEIDGD